MKRLALLFFKHAKNFSKAVNKVTYGIDYFEPNHEVLMKISKIMSKYLAPMEWIDNNTVKLSDIELGRSYSKLIVTIS